jgi:hypothetical protein
VPRLRILTLFEILSEGTEPTEEHHLCRDNARLVWDRLPMTIAFMSMVAAIIAERISVRMGLWLLRFFFSLGWAA